MAETLRRAGRPLDSYRSLGFYVMAPQSQIDAGVFASQMTKESIRRAISQRVGMYDLVLRERELNHWFDQWVLPFVDRLSLECIAWESVVSSAQQEDPIFGVDLGRFYTLCIKFNGPAKETNS
jgi:hypothetical protein